MKPNITAMSINPNNNKELVHWSSRLGITVKELRNIILETGLVDPYAIRNHVRKDSLIFHPFSNGKKIIRRTIQLFF